MSTKKPRQQLAGLFVSLAAWAASVLCRCSQSASGRLFLERVVAPVHEGIAPGRSLHVFLVVRALGRVAGYVAVHLVHVGFVVGGEVGLFLVQDFDDALARVVANAGAVAAVLPHRFRLLGFEPLGQFGGRHVHIRFEGGVGVVRVGSFGRCHAAGVAGEWVV